MKFKEKSHTEVFFLLKKMKHWDTICINQRMGAEESPQKQQNIYKVIGTEQLTNE